MQGYCARKKDFFEKTAKKKRRDNRLSYSVVILRLFYFVRVRIGYARPFFEEVLDAERNYPVAEHG